MPPAPSRYSGSWAWTRSAKSTSTAAALSIGHPIGASGARVLTTLIYAMQDTGAANGMASLCLGGGEAVSLIVENM